MNFSISDSLPLLSTAFTKRVYAPSLKVGISNNTVQSADPLAFWYARESVFAALCPFPSPYWTSFNPLCVEVSPVISFAVPLNVTIVLWLKYLSLIAVFCSSGITKFGESKSNIYVNVFTVVRKNLSEATNVIVFFSLLSGFVIDNSQFPLPSRSFVFVSGVSE